MVFQIGMCVQGLLSLGAHFHVAGTTLSSCAGIQSSCFVCLFGLKGLERKQLSTRCQVSLLMSLDWRGSQCRTVRLESL